MYVFLFLTLFLSTFSILSYIQKLNREQAKILNPLLLCRLVVKALKVENSLSVTLHCTKHKQNSSAMSLMEDLLAIRIKVNPQVIVVNVVFGLISEQVKYTT